METKPNPYLVCPDCNTGELLAVAFRIKEDKQGYCRKHYEMRIGVRDKRGMLKW